MKGQVDGAATVTWELGTDTAAITESVEVTADPEETGNPPLTGPDVDVEETLLAIDTPGGITGIGELLDGVSTVAAIGATLGTGGRLGRTPTEEAVMAGFLVDENRSVGSSSGTLKLLSSVFSCSSSSLLRSSYFSRMVLNLSAHVILSCFVSLNFLYSTSCRMSSQR